MSVDRPRIGPRPPNDSYLCWVQRSLLRHGWPPPAVDGSDSAGYRAAVRAFQDEYGLPKRGAPGEVDEATQDRLIRLNHVDANYTAWVQDALIKAGLLDAGVKRAEPIMEQAGSLTRRAIRRLQQARFEKDASLGADGWVGVKTERALRAFSKTAPPGATGRPVPCIFAPPPPTRPPKPGPDFGVSDADRLAQQLRNLLARQEDHWRAFRPEALCLVEALLRPDVDDRFVHPLAAERREFKLAGATRLLMRWSKGVFIPGETRCADPERCVIRLSDLIVAGIEKVRQVYSILAPDTPIEALRQSPEGKLAQFIATKAQQRSCIYHCHAAWIADTFRGI